MCDAVRHLLDLGHRRIALVSGELEVRASRARIDGLRLAFAERGIPDDSIVMTGPYSSDHGALATTRLLSLAEPPSAIVAGGNQILLGVLRVLRDWNLCPGRDISLVTCDDTPLTALLDPPIAAVSRDNVAIGRSAGTLLLQAITDGPGDERVMLPTIFVPRASCASGPAAAEPEGKAC